MNARLPRRGGLSITKRVRAFVSAVGERSERATDRTARMRESTDSFCQDAARDPLKVVEARNARLTEADLLVEW